MIRVYLLIPFREYTRALLTPQIYAFRLMSLRIRYRTLAMTNALLRKEIIPGNLIGLPARMVSYGL